MKANKKFILHEVSPDGSIKEISLNLKLDSSNNISEIPILTNVSQDFFEIIHEQQRRINELTTKVNKIIKFLN